MFFHLFEDNFILLICCFTHNYGQQMQVNQFLNIIKKEAVTLEDCMQGNY